jgi:hypothetical protein
MQIAHHHLCKTLHSIVSESDMRFFFQNLFNCFFVMELSYLFTENALVTYSKYLYETTSGIKVYKV